MAQKVIIDTDPGVDDAMAILFALRSPELEVIGLTTVFGNCGVEAGTLNALRLVELEGNGHIPVYKGADVPLVRPRGRLATFVHGEQGMGSIQDFPLPAGKPASIPAAQYLVETIMANPGQITLLPVGPLTNIGLALLLEPAIAQNVKEVIIMGGSAYARGNATPSAEANIHNDPEAAALVFKAGWPLTMVGLDVTTRTVMTPDFLAELFAAGNPAVDLLSRMLPFYQKYFSDLVGTGGSIHTHDPSAVAYALDPSLFKTQRMPVYVETAGFSAGDTIPDPHHQWIDGPDVNVCLDVDADRLRALYRQRITA